MDWWMEGQPEGQISINQFQLTNYFCRWYHQSLPIVFYCTKIICTKKINWTYDAWINFKRQFFLMFWRVQIYFQINDLYFSDIVVDEAHNVLFSFPEDSMSPALKVLVTLQNREAFQWKAIRPLAKRFMDTILVEDVLRWGRSISPGVWGKALSPDPSPCWNMNRRH